MAVFSMPSRLPSMRFETGIRSIIVGLMRRSVLRRML
jgi:hypothetical protein